MNEYEVPKLSLIMATYGRKEEVSVFCSKLVEQSFPKDQFELIIVDQNETDILSEIIDHYSSIIKIVHIRSNIKGLSYNRNIGINNAKGSWLGFPDDDCYYYHDTLNGLFSEIDSFPETDCILGQLYNRSTQKKIQRNFPDKRKKITPYNFYLCITSNTIFIRNKNILFDDRFGVGARWGANEDADLVFRILKNSKGKVLYTPTIQVWHPDQVGHKLPVEKVYTYGFGFGAFARKNMCVSMLILLAKVLCYHGLKGLVLHKSRIAFCSRIKGFLDYEK